jgi:phenylpropionate dioxygenase-like ring-hydroxylating dioxygenase large terminal subunit
VPYAEGFCGIDRAAYGLIELPAEERHGLVWVQLEPGSRLDVAGFLGALDAELRAYGLSAYSVERTHVLHEEVNWKLIVDGFLETYHLRFLHSDTVGPYFHTNLAAFRAFGAHGCVVVVRKSFDAVRSCPPEQIDLLPYLAVVYQIFPNTVLVWQADHFELWLVFPEGGRPDRVVMRVSLLAPQQPRREREHWDRNWRILMDTICKEDFPLARTIQQGIAAGLHTHVTFGRNEPTLQHYHRKLRAALERG